MCKIVNLGSPQSIDELDKKIEELKEEEFPLKFRVFETDFYLDSKKDLVSSYSAFRAMYKNITGKD